MQWWWWWWGDCHGGSSVNHAPGHRCVLDTHSYVSNDKSLCVVTCVCVLCSVMSNESWGLWVQLWCNGVDRDPLDFRGRFPVIPSGAPLLAASDFFIAAPEPSFQLHCFSLITRFRSENPNNLAIGCCQDGNSNGTKNSCKIPERVLAGDKSVTFDIFRHSPPFRIQISVGSRFPKSDVC